MDLTASLQRVPKWAWYTSAGVGIGAVALYVVNNRGDEGTPATGDEGATDTANAGVTGYPDTYGPSPVPGIVVPSINIPESNAGSQGYLELHNLYMEGLRDVLDSIGGGGAAAAPAPVLPSPLPVVITGGGAPSTPRNGVSTVQPAHRKDKCVGRYPHEDKSGAHKGKCFFLQPEFHSVKQGGKWYCVKQQRAHYKNGGTEWKGVISKRKGKC